jgi:hypothetical protein
MVYQRMFRSVMLLCLSGLAFAACSSDTPQTPQQKYCTAKCNCNKCTPNESSTCLDDIVNLGTEARAASCKDAYDTLLTCLNADGVCTDGLYDDSACFNEDTDLRTCINPPPACKTIDNGICNEPPPKGDGTCATGTDVKDCMAPACPTTNNGVCDEPQGTGTCAAGTDTLDCPCTKCLSYTFDQTVGTLCTASNTVFTALLSCACDNAKCLASCGDISDVCGGGKLSNNCYTCLTSLCVTEYNACMADM